MKRKIYNELLDWKNNYDGKSLMLMGTRQVGKTYIIDLYKTRLTSQEKFIKLKSYVGFDIEKENTCLFIDEIQESEELISELKYFSEKHSNIRIICSNSLLGIKFKRASFSFPVGKVKRVQLQKAMLQMN